MTIKFADLNDYELIELAQSGNSDALESIFIKYKFLIAKIIVKYNLADQYDDMFQEGLIVLYRSIKKFDDSRNKSFTRYFESNLENRYCTLYNVRKKQPVVLSEENFYIYESEPIYDYSYAIEAIDEKIDELTKLERQIFEERVKNKLSVEETAEKLKVSKKKVYNALHRVKTKIKSLEK